jgi:cellulose synthase/poly-beta-1,6-N-acetylglucosamine synthase-like glycosyltransferase
VAVTERSDPGRRGKGFALAHAAIALESTAPEVVIVLDADCSTDAHSISALISATAAAGRPSQAINLLRPAPDETALVQLSTFAFLLKNLVRQRGLQRLAGRVHLTGTGMALPWALFARADLASRSIVEDVRLGLELAEAGQSPQLVSEAHVWSDPSNQTGTLTQRTRWEGGYIAIAAKNAPRLLWHGLLRLSPRKLAAALDLCVPPLALLALVDTAVLALAAFATWLVEADWWPILLHACAMAAAGLAALLVWWREGRPFVSAGVLMRLPLYLLWKIPVYLKLARRGSRIDWLRPDR